MKVPYSMSCSEMRSTPAGEELWSYLMGTRGHRMWTLDQFKRHADVDTFTPLEEGQTLDEFLSDDPDSRLCSVYMAGGPPYILWLNYAGFEFFFATPEVMEEMMRDSERRVRREAEGN